MEPSTSPSPSQIPLIFQKGTHSNSYFQLQKQGVQFLKTLQTSKLKVIFNVSTQVNISPFTSMFASGSESNSDLKLLPEGVISSLSIMSKTEVLEGSTLVIVKARQSSASLNYLTLGYLVASLFIYHSENEQSLNSQTIGHLAALFDKFSKSHLAELNRQSILGPGHTEQPGLLCIIHNSDSTSPSQNQLGFSQQLFKTVTLDQRYSIPKVTQHLSQYFPSRAAFYLPSNPISLKQRITSMKSHLTSNLPTRKLLNFELTGSTLEALCYELCEIYNEKTRKDINLLAVCTQAVGSQKNRVTQQMTALAVNYLVERVTEMPVEVEEMMRLRDMAEREVDRQMGISALGCMELGEYLVAREEVEGKMREVYGEMYKENNRMAEAVNNSLLAELSTLDTSNTDIQHLTQQLTQKISLFCSKVSGSGIRKSIVEFIQSLTAEYTISITQTFETQTHLIQSLQLQKQQSLLALSNLQTMNTQFQKRFQSLLSQASSLSCSDLTSMRQSLNKKQSKNSAYKRQLQQLKKDTKSMSQQLLQKTIQLDQLYSLIQRYQNTIQKQKSRTKSKCEFARLIREFNECVESFHNASNDIERIEDVVKAAKKEIDSRKEEMMKEQDRLLTDIEWLKEEKKKGVDELQLVVEANQKAQQTIQLFEKIVEFNKNGIERSANQNINQKILIAEMESKIMLYRKSIELITDYYKKGKSEPLIKFTKVLQQQDIKQLLLSILKK